MVMQNTLELEQEMQTLTMALHMHRLKSFHKYILMATVAHTDAAAPSN